MGWFKIHRHDSGREISLRGVALVHHLHNTDHTLRPETVAVVGIQLSNLLISRNTIKS